MLHIGNLQLGLDSLLLIIAVMCFALICSVHAMIYKREAYAAFAWLGVMLLSPIIFSVMFLIWDWQGVLIIAPIIASLSYLFLGINRLTRQFRQGLFGVVTSALITISVKWLSHYCSIIGNGERLLLPVII